MSSPELQRQPAAVPEWPAGLLHIAALLGNGSPGARADIAALYHTRPQPSEAALRQELTILLVATLRDAATAFAAAVGCDAPAMLRFAGPHTQEPHLAGRHATLHRLDRCWNGPVQYSVRAGAEFAITWPAPVSTEVLALEGDVAVNGVPLRDHECRPLRVGHELRLSPRALALVRRTALSILLEAAAEAGLDLNEIFGGLSGDVLAVKTPAGPLTLDSHRNLVSINERVLRLNESETATLRTLLQHPGVVTRREALNESVGLDADRTLDRIMLGLRNKLGDGVIHTVYGVGYVLEGSD